MLTTQHRVVRCAAALALASGLASTSLGADAHYRVVARTGQAAPGGGVFSEFSAPVITPSGRVAFKAALNGGFNPSGLWSEGVAGMNNLALAARQGDPIPGVANTLIGSLDPDTGTPIMNAAGEVAFAVEIAGDQEVFGDYAILTHGAGGVDVIAAPGQLVSLPCGGFGCQRWMTDINRHYYAFNDAGQVLFHADIDGTGVNADNDHLVLFGDGGPVDVLLREGDAPPNTIGVEYTGSYWHQPHLNDNGVALIRNMLVDGAGTASYWSAWRGVPGDFSLIAAQTWTTPEGGEFGGHWIGGGEMSINNDGDALFGQVAYFSEFDQRFGIWLESEGAIEAICFEGMPAPGGHTYQQPEHFSGEINTNGDTLFRAFIQGPGVTSDSDFVLVRRLANGAQTIIAREGAQAPGLFNGVTMQYVGWFGDALLNDGRVVFGSNLEGPGISEFNETALWITRPGAVPALLLQKGQALVVGGAIRNVEEFYPVLGLGADSGYERSVSELGQVSMLVRFTDGTEAIIVASPKGVCPGDVNGDGAVDFLDLNIVLSAFNTSGDVVPGDIDLDGEVDFADLNLVLNSFNENCETGPVAR